MYWLQRQRTAGAYITIGVYSTHEEAVDALATIAAETPHRPYCGQDKYQDSKNSHHVNRYRIIKSLGI